MSHINDINKANIPQHVAIIMDGNGRWAEQQGKDRSEGHKEGAMALKACIESAAEIGVKYLTAYAFSTENWARPKDEVDGLMELLVFLINKETPNLKSNNVSLRVIGDTSSLPTNVQEQLNWSVNELANCSGLTVVVALSYSGKWDITTACKKIAKQVAAGEISPADITENLIEKNLDTYGLPSPELLIRTSGEIRISNFLLWQTAYTEFYFTDVLWPDFDKEHLVNAILDYQMRQRRFGKL